MEEAWTEVTVDSMEMLEEDTWDGTNVEVLVSSLMVDDVESRLSDEVLLRWWMCRK